MAALAVCAIRGISLGICGADCAVALANRRDPDAISSIVGRTHTAIRSGHVKERRELSDQEFAAALTTEFALPLTPDEIAALVAAPAGD